MNRFEAFVAEKLTLQAERQAFADAMAFFRASSGAIIYV